MSERQVRLCDHCGGVDDHPRHVIHYAPGDGVTDPEVATKALQAVAGGDEEAFKEVIAQVQDTALKTFHMDCCREAGCPDGSCDEVTQGAEDLRGGDLVDHLEGLRN